MTNQKPIQIHKVLFINPYPWYSKGTNTATLYPPLGLAYLAATLEQNTIECKIIDAAALHTSTQQIIEEIHKFKPDIIGITTNIVTAKSAIDLGIVLRQKFPKTWIIYGGPYATAETNRILKQTKGDIVVRGEGELTIIDLIAHLDNLSSIKGISYRNGRTIRHNQERELIENLDSIPFPAYHLLPNFKHYRSRSRRIPIGFLVSSRGCPYGCIYCNKNIFGKRFRMRSPANVLKEIELLIQRYNVKQIDILDDNFTLSMPRAEKIFDEIIQRKIHVLFNFQNGIRADKITRNLARKMKRAGVYKAGIGIESGDPAIQKIIKKSLDLKTVIKASKMLREEGIIVVGFFMIGIPGETESAIQKTIDFAITVNPHIANFSMVVPLPQTELFEMIQKGGKFIHDITLGSDTGFYTDDFNFEYGEINQTFIKKYASKAYKEFYLRPSKILDIIFSIKSIDELHWIIDTAKPLIRFLCR